MSSDGYFTCSNNLHNWIIQRHFEQTCLWRNLLTSLWPREMSLQSHMSPLIVRYNRCIVYAKTWDCCDMNLPRLKEPNPLAISYSQPLSGLPHARPGIRGLPLPGCSIWCPFPFLQPVSPLFTLPWQRHWQGCMPFHSPMPVLVKPLPAWWSALFIGFCSFRPHWAMPVCYCCMPRF